MRTAAQTAMLMAILTLISKCFGFVREMVMANYFGTSYITDAYVMASAVPNIVFAAIFSALATAYMPIYSNKLEKNGEIEANKFTSGVITLLLIVSLFSAAIGIIFSDQLVAVFASGFHGETADLTAFYIKITFSYTMFSSVVLILEALLQYKGVFLSQIVIGYVQNIIVIILTMVSAYYNHYLLAFGWLLANMVRLAYIGRLSARHKFQYNPMVRLRGAAKLILPLAIPVFIGSSVSQIGAFVDKTLASGLPEGSVSALNYGNLLAGMISGLTLAIVTTITYPKLTQANSLNNQERFSDILERGMIIVIMIAIPCTLGVVAFSKEIVEIMFQRGVFDSGATAWTASAFLFYSMGLVFIAINTLLIQVFYSNHNTKTPVALGAAAVGVDIILNFLLIRTMAHNGLALSTSIGQMVQMLLLYGAVRKYYPHLKFTKLKRKLALINLASVFAVGISYLLYRFILPALTGIVVIKLGIAVIAAGIIYLGFLIIFKIEEVNMIKEIVRR